MIISKNYKRTENQLVEILVYLCCVLFFGEFIRHLLPLSYSSIFVHHFTASIGILVHSIKIHFYIHITNLRDRIKIPFYTLIFYVPLLIIVAVKTMNRTGSHDLLFVQNGIWYVPVLGMYHYLLIKSSVSLIFISLLLLLNGLKDAKSVIKYRLIRLLTVGNMIALLLLSVLGFKSYEGVVPPFPILLIGILLTAFLSISVFRYQLLPSTVKKYETEKIMFYTIWRNVTEELEKERLIERMAYHDSLTGLHNKAYFVAEVKKK